MSTNAQNLTGIRRRLGHPLANAPDDGVLLQCLIDQLAHHTTQLSNTPNHWSIESCALSASSGTEDYIITGANFGRPFLVYTEDTSDTYHVRREIPFTLMQNADRLYSGPQQTGSSDEHTAAEIVFYRRGASTSSWYARLVPIPGASGDYRIWYETVYEYGALGDAPGLQAFHHLLRVQAAISALPYCEWRGASLADNAAAWELKVRSLTAALAHDEAIYQRQFDEYKSQQSREGVSSKLGYGWDYEDGGMGAGRMISGYGI